MTARAGPIALTVLAAGILLALGIWLGTGLTGSGSMTGGDDTSARTGSEDETLAPSGSEEDLDDVTDPASDEPTLPDAPTDGDTGEDGDDEERPNEREPLPDGTIHDRQIVANGAAHTCARHPDGGVSCWGRDSVGQAGGASVNNEAAAPTRINGLAGVVDLAAGGNLSCALTDDGALWCWGQLRSPNGSGSSGPRTGADPLAVVNPASGQPAVLAMDVGEHHACAVLEGGALSCWGYDQAGQLGRPGESPTMGPEQVAGIDGTVDVAVGNDHTCALHENGRVSCWGGNEYRQLGVDAPDASREPVTVPGVENAVTLIGATYRTCAIDHTGAVTCWGANVPGGPAGQDTTPPVELPTFARVVTMSHHASEICAIDIEDQLHCVGMTGLSLDDQQSSPPTATSPAGFPDDAPAADVSVAAHACAALRDGAVRCWGFGSDALQWDAEGRVQGPVWLPLRPIVGLDPVG